MEAGGLGSARGRRDVGLLAGAVERGATAILAKIGVAGVDSNLATAVRTSVVLIFSWMVAYATAPSVALKSLSSRTWLFLVLSGLGTGLSWLCYYRALQTGPASRVAPIDKLSVIFVVLFAVSFLGERLTWKVGLGSALITLGAVLMAL